MQGKNSTLASEAALKIPNRALDFIGPRHENKHIAIGVLKVSHNGIRCRFPDRLIFGIMSNVGDRDRKHAPLGCEDFRRTQIFLQLGPVEGCRHHNNF